MYAQLGKSTLDMFVYPFELYHSSSHFAEVGGGEGPACKQ